MNQPHNILLTGSTGILGSHLLYELLEKYASGEWSGKLGLLIRPTRCLSESPQKRLNKVLQPEHLPNFLKKYKLDELLRLVFIIRASSNTFSASDLAKSFKDILVLHAAGSVNLGNDRKAKSDIEKNNLQGTLHFLDEILPRTRKFCFVSTAYVSGHREGKIENDLLAINNCNLRNPYEEVKNKLEHVIVEKCNKSGVQWQIFRPGIICGRLMEPPLYMIPRFTVFYLIGKFVHLARRGTFGEPHLQIFAPQESGLNILPVDYVAKAIVRSMEMAEQQINLVHSENVSAHHLFATGFSVMGYQQYTLLQSKTEHQSTISLLYDKIINNQLLPYLETPGHLFDSTLIRTIMGDFPEPNIVDHFSELVQFAVTHRFKNLF